MNKKLLTAIFGSVLMLAACGGDDDTAAPTGEDVEVVESQDAEKIAQGKCISCHGGNLEGQGNAPAINDVGSRLSQEEILNVILNGQGAMPPKIIEGAEAEVVAEWLSTKK
ncbi:cytochrome c551 [Paenisporosarcina sp. TG-14]|uniref:cytochrome c551 n=1 Tax=Paenisporosarcina sp. TG-14 TaxID=1231057 RepID=UPI0002FB467C|nr:cytochrome c [Paenisporosarcina sp. TG-14]